MQRLLAIMLAAIIVAIPIAFLLTIVLTGSINQSITNVFLVLVVWTLTTLSLGVLNRLGQDFIQRFADTIVDWAEQLLASHKKTYLEYLSARHKFFETKGLTVQGDYNLELDRVYVELVLGQPETSSPDQPTSIWQHMSAQLEQSKRCRLVILGLPGSGKTTLLRHMVLSLSNSQGDSPKPVPPYDVPVFITLRDLAANLQNGHDYSLATAIKDTLAGRAKRDSINLV